MKCPGQPKAVVPAAVLLAADEASYISGAMIAVTGGLVMDLTADLVYCRLHGSQTLYDSGYDEDARGRWARRVRTWSEGGEPRDARRIASRTRPRPQGRDVFVFFDNTEKVNAECAGTRAAPRPRGLTGHSRAAAYR